MLRITHCLDNQFIDGGKVVSITHPPHNADEGTNTIIKIPKKSSVFRDIKAM
jgi:hypothetical protein